MKNIITERFAAIALLTLLSLMALFHVLILLNILPYDMVWGGRIADTTRMCRLELISLVVHLLMLTVIAIKAGMINVRVNPMLTTILLWLMFGLFLLNTLGNLMSLNAFERIVFTPLTILLSLFCLRLVMGRKRPTYLNTDAGSS
jgi:hypothetical protein